MADRGSDLQLERTCRWIYGCKDGRLTLLGHDHRGFVGCVLQIHIPRLMICSWLFIRGGKL